MECFISKHSTQSYHRRILFTDFSSYPHSDQGFQYTSHGYFKLTQSYGILPSMSRRGNCYDNALAENFFGILKTECIYRHKPATFQEAKEMIDRYIHFYNHERIQLKTGVAPLTLRHST
ncbi:MAG: transposase [Anaerotignum lactatifermentans]